jgi:hypothetical protein
MHNKSVNQTAKKLRFLLSGCVQRWARMYASSES